MNHRTAVNAQRARARMCSLPATLTHDEWTRTVAAFDGACAYCQSAPAAHLDHFVPIAAGGGTTPGNSLPACEECNTAKSGKHPEELGGAFDGARVEALRSYLAARSTGQDTAPRVLLAPSEVVGVRVPRDVLAAVDARVEALNTSGDVPSKVTRAGLILYVIRGAVTEWERAK